MIKKKIFTSLNFLFCTFRLFRVHVKILLTNKKKIETKENLNRLAVYKV